MVLYIIAIYVGFIYNMYIEIIYKIQKNTFYPESFISYIKQNNNKLQG